MSNLSDLNTPVILCQRRLITPPPPLKTIWSPSKSSDPPDDRWLLLNVMNSRISIRLRFRAVISFYHIKYGVIQGFPALRKAVTTHVEKYRNFYVCLISPMSCWHVIRFSRHSVMLMNERRSLSYSQSKVVCRNFFRLWLLKHWKIRIAYRQWRLNFLRRGRKPKHGKKSRKLHIQWFW